MACKAAFYTFQLYITSEVNSTTRRFFYHTLQTLDRMQFFIILQKKNCTHSIFWTIEARASFAQNIKELTTLENVFWKTEFHNVETGSHNNLLLCGIQGNNGLLAKLFKKIPKWLFRLAGSHFWHRQIWNASYWEFEWILIELRFSIKGVIRFILDYGFLPMCNL